MSGATILAVGAVSAFGAGDAAFSVGGAGETARVAIARDEALERAGFARPIAARAFAPLPTEADRAAALLRAALEQCVARLGEVRPDWRDRRVGLAMGTSSGGILTAETFFAARARGERIAKPLARGATYFAPLEAVTSALGVDFAPRVLVLGACASATLAIGLALRWLELGRCDLALAGGFDALSEFVASGFEALRATTATAPRPFRAGRDGMALGEGAAVLALELRASHAGARRDDGARHRHAARGEASPEIARAAAGGVGGDRASAPVFPDVIGFAASTDAVHVTAPDKTGHGLGRAATFALSDAGIDAQAVGMVSAHATATPFNDAAEAKSMRIALGDGGPKIVHPFKAQIGHTLGAAGALEALALLDAMRRGIAPAAAGDGDLDPECGVPLLSVNTPFASVPALKLSSAFGGANAALVFTPRTRDAARSHGEDHRTTSKPNPRRARPVYLQMSLTLGTAFDQRQLAERLGQRHPNLPRLDALAKLVLSAVHNLSIVTGPAALENGGLILGHTLATLESNELFDARRRERGPRHVEPRRFPSTSPNAAAGETAIAYRLSGPTFAVGGSLHGGLEALSVARDLVAAGDADVMVVVAADLAGPVSSDLLRAAKAPPLPAGACAVLLSASPALAGLLAPLSSLELDGEVPLTLGTSSDWVWAGPAGHVELAAYLKSIAEQHRRGA